MVQAAPVMPRRPTLSPGAGERRRNGERWVSTHREFRGGVVSQFDQSHILADWPLPLHAAPSVSAQCRGTEILSGRRGRQRIFRALPIGLRRAASRRRGKRHCRPRFSFVGVCSTQRHQYIEAQRPWVRYEPVQELLRVSGAGFLVSAQGAGSSNSLGHRPRKRQFRTWKP